MKKAFTLVELVISIAFVGILGSIIVMAIGGCDADWQRAEQSAKEFASKVPGATGKVSCMKMDSDMDGYCRCTIFKEKGDPLYVECGCDKHCLFCKEGCSGISHKIKVRGR